MKQIHNNNKCSGLMINGPHLSQSKSGPFIQLVNLSDIANVGNVPSQNGLVIRNVHLSSGPFKWRYRLPGPMFLYPPTNSLHFQLV